MVIGPCARYSLAVSDPEISSDKSILAGELRSIAQSPPSNTHIDTGPWDYLTRAPAILVESTVRPLMHDFLLDPDPFVRRNALSTLSQLPKTAATFERLCDAAKHHRDLFYGVTIRSRSLGAGLQLAISNFASDELPEGRVAARALLALINGDPPVSKAGVQLVARFESGGLLALANAESGIDDQTGWWIEAAASMGFFHQDQLLDLLRALSRTSQQMRAAILEGAVRGLAMPRERAAAWAAADGNPPPRTSPTEADCRKALGLE